MQATAMEEDEDAEDDDAQPAQAAMLTSRAAHRAVFQSAVSIQH